jgi:hypothetical protein
VAERTLTQRQLNRALLARQLLLERVRMPIPRALERIGGIQDQYAPNAYIRLWSCLDGFQRDDLTRALERRSVIQATLMRGTIHVVSKRDYWPFAVAIRAAQREWLVRAWKVTERELERQADQVRLLLAEGPRRAAGRGTPRSAWCVFPRPGRGSADVPTSSSSPTVGSVPSTRRRTRPAFTSSGATSPRSGRRPVRTSRRGRV